MGRGMYLLTISPFQIGSNMGDWLNSERVFSGEPPLQTNKIVQRLCKAEAGQNLRSFIMAPATATTRSSQKVSQKNKVGSKLTDTYSYSANFFFKEFMEQFRLKFYKQNKVAPSLNTLSDQSQSCQNHQQKWSWMKRDGSRPFKWHFLWWVKFSSYESYIKSSLFYHSDCLGTSYR